MISIGRLFEGMQAADDAIAYLAGEAWRLSGRRRGRQLKRDPYKRRVQRLTVILRLYSIRHWYVVCLIIPVRSLRLKCLILVAVLRGGGRYDKMVGKFTGKDTPACGFSIGFERIITILLDQGFQVPGSAEKIAFLVEKGMDADRTL